jgi:hypothetical protein
MTDTANDSKAEQITRERIAEIVQARATMARVHPVWVMAVADGENANILRSDTHTVGSEKMIHAYMVTRTKGTSKRITTSTGLAQTRAALRTITIEHRFTYRIRGIRFFKHGGESGVHSENEFKEEITLIATDLAAAFNLNLDKTVDGDGLVQIEGEGFNTYSKQQCHQSDLTFTVCLIQTINS